MTVTLLTFLNVDSSRTFQVSLNLVFYTCSHKYHFAIIIIIIIINIIRFITQQMQPHISYTMH